MKIDGECLIELIGSCRNKGAENPSLSRLYYRGLWGSRNRRALILGWAYYLDAFSSYPLRTWLPSVYRGHDNWYTRGSPIFTDMSISPSLSPRQCPDRYAFRAGRNLPDKEFRYLRTVIVTAAVHRGFGRRLPCHQASAPIRGLTTSRRPVFLVNSRPGLVTATPFVRRHPFSRSYGAILPSSLESCLAPLGILYLPTCVGFGYRYPFVEGRSSFSWEYGMGYFSAVAPGTRTLGSRHFLYPFLPCPEKASLLRPSGPTRGSTGIFTCCPSTTPFGLILGPDSPSVDEPCGGTLRHAVRDQFSPPTAWELTVSCSISLPDGVLFTFPSRYYFAIGHPGYLALQGGPCGFTRDSTCPMLLGSGFARLSLACPWIQQQFERLTYSGISGSMLIFNSPKHFVACYALPRLWVPRYPP
ncbi:hypothetical protein H6P81_021265 [Aristolochia fimbriata]|uniref:Uncharacterized protein n=1 Tax=Aristolochia fimbriata TaxID=158543 RepID=A0AAV7DQC7_ARIFI|nr:hypothetical protein H6P81_021265 [Aristolochia fimbriata]